MSAKFMFEKNILKRNIQNKKSHCKFDLVQLALDNRRSNSDKRYCQIWVWLVVSKFESAVG